ncbi:MAG TPA: PLP-dependent aminotransferase family protein, partial [Acidimicrobiales bacterium]|nr:PLP-dependent aminotransferase family protein [Acidimicrobiales bacterium]
GGGGGVLDEDTDTADLLTAAIDAGVAYVPGSAFAVDTPRPHHLRLSFATAAPEDMDTAVARLATVLP